MVNEWMTEMMELQGCSEESFATAQYNSLSGLIELSANNAGENGNDIVLFGDGSQTVQEVIVAWNASNPTNTVTVTSGLIYTTDIMPVKDIINFTGGSLGGCFDVFNTKEDAEVLKGLFLGRVAYEQYVDTHSIKTLKMWDIL